MSIATIDIHVKPPPRRPRARAWAAFALFVVVLATALPAYAQRAPAAVPQKLVDGLSSSSEKARVVAIAGVVRTKSPQARALIEPLLTDPDPVVRVAAVEGLRTLGDLAALPALRVSQNDGDARVSKAALRATVELDALVIRVDIGDAQDLTGKAPAGLVPLLQDGVQRSLEASLGPRVSVQRGNVLKGQGLLLRIRAIEVKRQGANGIVEVVCEMTLVELPKKTLRISSKATAAAGVEGDVPPKMIPELATDAVAACAPALADDFVDYARERLPPG